MVSWKYGCLSLYKFSVWPAFANLDTVIKKADLTQQILDDDQNFGILGRCRSGRRGGRGLGLLGEKVLYQRDPRGEGRRLGAFSRWRSGGIGPGSGRKGEGPGAGVGVDGEAADAEALDAGVFLVVAVATMC